MESHPRHLEDAGHRRELLEGLQGKRLGGGVEMEGRAEVGML